LLGIFCETLIFCKMYFIVGINFCVNKFQLYPCRVNFLSFFYNFYEKKLCDNPLRLPLLKNQNWFVFRDLNDIFYTNNDKHLRTTMWNNSSMTFCKCFIINICFHHENKSWYFTKKWIKFWMCLVVSIRSDKFDVHPYEIIWT
jgi:hypothetical protein